MDGRDMMGHNKVLQIHQASDGKPSIHPGWPFKIASPPAALEVAYPQKKFNREPHIQREKRELHGAANLLRAVTQDAAYERLPLLRGKSFGCGCCEWKRGSSRHGILSLSTIAK